MTKLGIIAGTVLFGTELFKKGRVRKVKTKYGAVTLINHKKLFFLPRHGIKKKIPPHRINYRANLSAFKKIGVKRIISLNSTGSLKRGLGPMSIVVPSDYLNIWDIPAFYDDRLHHVVPELDEKLRQTIIRAAKKLGMRVMPKGIYINTPGARYETKAEVRFLRQFGDIVGKTMAKEATIARELGLCFAAICSVDNYAHGLTKEKLTYQEMLKVADNNSRNLVRLLFKTIEELE